MASLGTTIASIRVGDLAGAQLAVARSQHAYPRCEAVTDILVITAFRLCAVLGSRDPYALAATVTAAVAKCELARDEGSPERMKHAARRLKILSDASYPGLVSVMTILRPLSWRQLSPSPPRRPRSRWPAR